MTFKDMTFKDILQKYEQIIIPKIQRDYAQGRLDKKATEIREKLLSDIFSGKKISFDFIFGTKGENKNNFIPLDGQQRLTTLFLLHLYQFQQSPSSNNNPFVNKGITKFTYETRTASKDFCEHLISQKWKCDNKKKPSEVIKDSTWFMDYWQYDPTVECMLQMLDSIYEKSQKTNFPDLGKITFEFFALDEYNLNENLYIKMNSRGKPLTAFENLKAEIENHLPANIDFDFNNLVVDNTYDSFQKR